MKWQQFIGYSLNCCHLNILLATWWIFFLSISMRDVIYEALNTAYSSVVNSLSIGKIADSFRFSRITISGFWLVDFHSLSTQLSFVIREKAQKRKIFHLMTILWMKILLYEGVWMRMFYYHLDQTGQTLALTITLYNGDLHKRIADRTARPNLKQMGYSRMRTWKVHLLPDRNKIARLKFLKNHKYWTIEF